MKVNDGRLAHLGLVAQWNSLSSKAYVFEDKLSQTDFYFVRLSSKTCVFEENLTKSLSISQFD